jgi:hypothetical protein
VTYSLTRIPTHRIVEHLRRNATPTAKQPTALLQYPWYYLSNFYASPTAPPGYATWHLKTSLTKLSPHPYILCCEPILGTDPRAITAKTAHMTPDSRYTNLCNYYATRFGLTSALPTCTTLKTELTGHGRKWSDCERHLMYGLVTSSPSASPPTKLESVGTYPD